MENKRKLVYADEFLNHVRCEIERANKVHGGQSGFVEWTENFAYLVDELLKDLPPVDAAPVVYGHWIEIRDKFGYCIGMKCSNCGRRVRNCGENFCPKCGAKNM